MFYGSAFLLLLAASITPAPGDLQYRASIVSLNDPRAPIVWTSKNPRSAIGFQSSVSFRLLISPAPPADLQISWRVLGNAFAVTDSKSAVTMPPSLIYRAPGFATLVATRDGSIQPLASRILYSYDSVYFGCAEFTSSHGVVFDKYGAAHEAESPKLADIYVTATHCSNSLDQTTAFDSSGPVTLHFPGGGTILKPTTAGLAGVKASQWRLSSTSAIDGDALDQAILLFKTRSGQEVKLLLPRKDVVEIDGPYAVATDNHFFDESDLSDARQDGITF